MQDKDGTRRKDQQCQKKKGKENGNIDSGNNDAELHSDLEALLLENGSKQNSLLGINYYPELEGEDFIEYDSMINIRPSQGNNSRGVENESIRKKIIDITNKWIKR